MEITLLMGWLMMAFMITMEALFGVTIAFTVLGREVIVFKHEIFVL